jgi:hypothetical protein
MGLSSINFRYPKAAKTGKIKKIIKNNSVGRSAADSVKRKYKTLLNP